MLVKLGIICNTNNQPYRYSIKLCYGQKLYVLYELFQQIGLHKGSKPEVLLIDISSEMKL